MSTIPKADYSLLSDRHSAALVSRDGSIDWMCVPRFDGPSVFTGAFALSFGSDELDASRLMLALVGFLPADEPRMLATIKATQERQTDERALVYRYRSHDGLDGAEGTFVLCTSWLTQALARAGQTDRARSVFERAAVFVDDVGLLAEEADVVSAELRGNFPRAFSHIGLVDAAWAISESERQRESRAGGPGTSSA